MLSVRPKVAELAFHVFSRPLHPELYSIHQTRRIERSEYHAKIDITNCGHVITWKTTGRSFDAPSSGPKDAKSIQADLKGLSPLSKHAGLFDIEALCDTDSEDIDTGAGSVTLCEVATGVHQPLPKRRCLVKQALKGSRTERKTCRGGVTYRTHFQLEPVEPDLFFMVQQQLGKQPTEGLLHNFDASGRMAMGALSYINIETRRKSMLVQAIHTFPDDYAIVKVESLFSLPE
ncbi:DUF2617 domain-containing protein [Stieleria varia]|uniref:DUF2617 domain-containing protein n=1 Tax=Stieleria varia TaxID=2528005 RepID=A0A5C6AU17_9BACT|nr:DUF2617 domain-containing protein [Stieleria varia]TWU02512.1 hypothetical protein Pla52n_35620 [Stieleria varia]